jgi:hypothetical protein
VHSTQARRGSDARGKSKNTSKIAKIYLFITEGNRVSVRVSAM